MYLIHKKMFVMEHWGYHGIKRKLCFYKIKILIFGLEYDSDVYNFLKNNQCTHKLHILIPKISNEKFSCPSNQQ